MTQRMTLKQQFKSGLTPVSIEFVGRFLCATEWDVIRDLSIEYISSSVTLSEMTISLSYCARHPHPRAAAHIATALCTVLLEAKASPVKKLQRPRTLLRFLRQCRRACRSPMAAGLLRASMAGIGCKSAERAIARNIDEFKMPEIAYVLWTVRKLGTRCSHRSLKRIAESSRMHWVRVWAAQLLVMRHCSIGEGLLERQKSNARSQTEYNNILLGLTWAGDRSALEELEQIAIDHSDQEMLERLYNDVRLTVHNTPARSIFYKRLLEILGIRNLSSGGRS